MPMNIDAASVLYLVRPINDPGFVTVATTNPPGLLIAAMGEGACQPDIFTKYRLGCELSYGTCPISLCAL